MSENRTLQATSVVFAPKSAPINDPSCPAAGARAGYSSGAPRRQQLTPADSGSSSKATEVCRLFASCGCRNQARFLGALAATVKIKFSPHRRLHFCPSDFPGSALMPAKGAWLGLPRHLPRICYAFPPPDMFAAISLSTGSGTAPAHPASTNQPDSRDWARRPARAANA